MPSRRSQSVILLYWPVLLILSLNAAAATFTVNTTLDTLDIAPGNGICADSAGNCSLRAAIGETNQLAVNVATRINTIFLPAGIYTLTITGSPNEGNNLSGDLNIRNSSNLTITSDDARTTIIQAGTVKSTNGTDGNGIDRVFRSFGSNVILTLSNLTIRHGKAPDGVGFSNSGGAIEYNAGLTTSGRLNIINCAIVDNASTDSGGAIFTNTDTNISNSLIARNVAFTFNYGGAIFGGNSASLTKTLNIWNTTISGNSINTVTEGGNGGGIAFGGDLNITNSTIVNNTAIGTNGRGGGIASIANSVLRLRNTIVSGNQATNYGNDIGSADVSSPFAITSGGTNLIGDATTSTGWDATDLLNNTTANLGLLTNNGGQTDTHAFPGSSSVLNAGQNCVTDSTCPIFNAPTNLTTDQRGVTRLFDGSFQPFALFVDIGAVERIGPTAANVSISGRVFSESGVGLRNAVVTLTDSAGRISIARTGSFGFFRFDQIDSGQTVIVSVMSKQYQFNPQVISVNEQLNDLVFVPEAKNTANVLKIK